MKQSRLVFSSTAAAGEGSTSYRVKTDAIVVEDSDDDDGFATPPPPPSLLPPGPLQPAKQDNCIAVDVLPAASSSKKRKKPAKRQREDGSGPHDQGIGITDGVDKTARSSLTAQGDSHASELSSALSTNTTYSESRLCHQHRRACSPLLHCTRLKAGKRCTFKYCYSTLQRMYKQDAEQIIRAGRNKIGVDLKDHVGPEEASYLWKCPKCRGRCQCSACRKKAGLDPLGLIKDGSHIIADTDKAAVGESALKETPSSVKDVPAKKKSKADRLKAEAKGTSLADGFARASQNDHRPANVATERPRAALQQQTLQKPLREPALVEQPELTAVRSRLPVKNLKERIWLYECLVRFDSLGIGKAVLQRLDRFDDWTEWQVQQMLESLLCCVAGVSSVKTKTPRKVQQKLLDTFLATGKDLARGEVWSAARNYCQSKDVSITDLEPVAIQSHQIGLGAGAARRPTRAAPVETLLEGRLTRSRRAAEARALEMVKALSKRENEGSEEDSELSEDEDEGSEQSESQLDSSEEEEEPVRRRSTRQVAQRALHKPRTESSEEEKEGETISVTDKADEGAERADEDSVEMEEEASSGPLDAPPFESRIAVLSGLMEILLQSKSLNEELTQGFKQADLLEREAREEERELMTEQAAEVQAHNAKAPSMAHTDDFAQWKEEKQAMGKRHAYSLLDLRVHTHLLVEAHKTRSGPLGIDSDGNEYWHLSEYVEKKPFDVSGHWAWSLFVLGSHFYKVPAEPFHGNRAESDSFKKNGEEKKTKVDDPTDGDSVVVLVEVPARSNASCKERAAKVKGKEDCNMEFATPPPTQATQAMASDKTDAENPTVGFSSTSDEHQIAQLIAYIHYRLARCEYEENSQFREMEEASKAEALHDSISIQVDTYERHDAGSNSASFAISSAGHQHSTGSAADKKRRKADLHEKQSERRQQVEKLLKNLEMVRMYHQWHAEDAS